MVTVPTRKRGSDRSTILDLIITKQPDKITDIDIKLSPLGSSEHATKYLNIKKYRSAYAKFRCGVAPIKIETCRYGLNRVPVEQRVCETCNIVEDEYHVVMDCKIYDDISDRLFTEICGISFQFRNLPLDNQFLQIMSNPQFYRAVSRAMYNILNRRRCNMLK